MSDLRQTIRVDHILLFDGPAVPFPRPREIEVARFWQLKSKELALPSQFFFFQLTVSIFYGLQRNGKVHLPTHVKFVSVLVVLDGQGLVVHWVIELVRDKFGFEQSEAVTVQVILETLEEFKC